MTEEVLEPLKTETRYLKFTTEKAAMTALKPFFYQEMGKDDEGEPVAVGDPILMQYSRDHAIDLVGVIVEPTGKLLEDDVPELAPLPGWHVNIRSLTRVHEDTINTLEEQFGVTVTNPRRRWA